VVGAVYNAAFYRKQADDARQSAARASTSWHRDEYLKLAAGWDRLADSSEDSARVAAATAAMDQLMRSIRKA
jgi:hypothetical protein